jgi:hypothetical protein
MAHDTELVIDRALGMLPIWLKRDAPRKKWLALELSQANLNQLAQSTTAGAALQVIR